ncbi:hypothetical protein EVAR_82083_1 [Eumeta japonica]|uniref:Uncharacterized protein n=1 Tax=Eumeta variegata TaxID=151549 RepID=A0A4C1U1T1_EUMVA|nr:hypothetical protein EVAR_82083_1 [Eumeta japonica]
MIRELKKKPDKCDSNSPTDGSVQICSDGLVMIVMASRGPHRTQGFRPPNVFLACLYRKDETVCYISHFLHVCIFVERTLMTYVLRVRCREEQIRKYNVQ